MVVNTNATDANRAFGASLQEILADQIRRVIATASPATIDRRRRYERDRNSRSYRKHYAGGRTGETPPSSTSTRLLNDSGRLATTTIRVRQRSTGQEVATINFPANRLHPDIVGDFTRISSVIRQYVPLIGGQADSKTQGDLIEALRKLQDASVAKSAADLERKRAELRALQLQVLKTIAKAIV